MHKFLKAVLIIAACSLALVSVAQDEPLRIVGTTTQASDLATILTDGVENVEIVGLAGPGVDPHLYQPTEADIAAMNEADLVIYSGLNLEGQFDAVFNALSEQNVPIFALSQPVKDAGFIVSEFDVETDSAGADDPHFWFDPRNWEISVVELVSQLSLIDPDNADIYDTNGADYIEQLQMLFEWADTGMSEVDEAQRYLVTSHDAFQYFGAAFGWQMQAIQGISTEDEAGVGDIQQTVTFVIDNEIPVLFVESSIPPDTIEAVVAAVEDEGGTVRVGVRELFGDAMGETDAFGGTFVGMIAHNVYTILQSYQCAGVELVIPDWPEDLEPAPSDELLDADCDAE